tara:strand:- start:436 stop:1158 length:723 start_codon:yes stop_codon:yes gene_type:complete
MKIGILQCDSTNLEFRSEHGNYPEMFISIFESVDRSLEFEVYDVQLNQYPKEIEECDAYLVTGSRFSVYDKNEWIWRLENYVIELHQRKHPLIGICFGHQIVAKALGGKTELAAKGWGVGVHKYSKTLSKSWLTPDLDNFSLIVSHQDQVTELPKGAELLAGSEFCPLAAFRIGEHVLTFQGHPEFSKDYSKVLIVLRKEKLGNTVYVEGLKSLVNPIHSQIIIKWITNFLRRAVYLHKK